jgi:hypothetical protein
MSKGQDVSVQLRCPDLDDSRLQSMTFDVMTSLRDQNIGKVRQPEKPVEVGMKGDPVTIGTIIMTLIGSGGVAVTLIDAMRPYFERKPVLKVELSRPDGKKVVLDAESVSPKQLSVTSEILNRFFES